MLFIPSSVDPSLRKKSKKKKRKTKDIERSSGDSDGQEQDENLKHLDVQDNVSLSHSGMEADSESQGSHDSKTEVASTDNANVDATTAIKNISENQVDSLKNLILVFKCTNKYKTGSGTF